MPAKKLPKSPSLEHLQKQAKKLLKAIEGCRDALTRIKNRHPRFANSSELDILYEHISLSEAQLVIAREYGFDSWPKLRHHVKSLPEMAANQIAPESAEAPEKTSGKESAARSSPQAPRRFYKTPGMERVMLYALREKIRSGTASLMAEHYMLAIIRKGDVLAAQALKNLHVDLNVLLTEIEEHLKLTSGSTVTGPNSPAPYPYDSPDDFLRSIDRIAQECGHGWCGTEHLLLALLRDEDSFPARYLREMGTGYDQALQEIRRLIEGDK